MKSTRAVLEDIARKLDGQAAAATELPEVTGSDNGKLLGVSGGKWTKVSAPAELPAVTGDDEGKVLMVNSEGQWVAASLPTTEETEPET